MSKIAFFSPFIKQHINQVAAEIWLSQDNSLVSNLFINKFTLSSAVNWVKMDEPLTVLAPKFSWNPQINGVQLAEKRNSS
jgi:hypothetical protein